MKPAQRSKLGRPELLIRQPLTKSSPRIPNFKTQKTLSATHVLKRTVQNPDSKRRMVAGGQLSVDRRQLQPIRNRSPSCILTTDH
jgi:hypothetical protein